jgi:four helix bundle protein
MSMPFQKLDVYVAARELARRVHAAQIRDDELRDQATRAAKSTFLNLCEALPQQGVGTKRRHLQVALGSLHEVAGAVDLAHAVDAINADDAEAVAMLSARLRKMLWALSR